MKRLLVVLVLLFASQVQAKVVTQTVEYRDGDAVLQGYLAYDDASAAKRPGVLVVHEWWGLNEFAKKKTEQVASLGYVAFAVDMYGKGLATTDPKLAGKLAGQFQCTPLGRERVKAGLKVLAENRLVDPKKVAAIGFCFGGTTVFELAYSGAEVAGVVSFHGGLPAPAPEDVKNIKAEFLAIHGADDPLVKPETVQLFQESMRKAGLDWQMIYYGGAVHSFTNPSAGDAKIPGVGYDEKADKRSWILMQDFLKEVIPF